MTATGSEVSTGRAGPRGRGSGPEPGGSDDDRGTPSGAPGTGDTDVAGPADDLLDGAAAGAEPGRARPELVALTVVAVAVGIVLRFVTRSGLWLDEALSVNIASLPLGEIGEALRHDGHPPLYYWLLHGWMALFGESNQAVRALSGLVAVATLPLAYVAGRRIGGRALGLLTLGVFALSPFLVRYGTETRMYSMVVLFVLGGYLLVDDLVRRGRRSWWRVALLAVTVGLLVWTHYWGLWVTAAAGLVLVWTWWRSPDPGRRAGAARALIGVVVGGLTLLPWVPTLLYQSAHTGTPWAGPLRPGAFLGQTLTDLGGGAFTDAQFVGGVLLVLLLLGVFGAGVGARRIELDLHGQTRVRGEAAVLGLTILLGMAVTYVTWTAYASRYASVFVPLVLVLVAAGIGCFAGRWTRAGVYGATLALLAMGGAYNITYQRTQTTDMAPVVAARAEPGSVVVACPDQLGPATMRAFPSDLVFVGYPTLDPPARIDWVDYAERPDPDPDAYAAEVLDLAGPDASVFVVWSPTYLTHPGACAALIDALGRQRPAVTLANENGSTYYEAANLTVFPPS